MNHGEQIEKACKDVTETCKDVIKLKLRDLVTEGFITLSYDQLTMVNNMINAGGDEAFYRSRNIFNTTVQTVLTQVKKG